MYGEGLDYISEDDVAIANFLPPSLPPLSLFHARLSDNVDHPSLWFQFFVS